MKNYIALIAILCSILTINAQAFKGSEDQKLQVGANLQDNGTGITVSYDYGVGENISLGLVTTYVLSAPEELDADFGDRVDLRARFNANIGEIITGGEKVDIYPGLSLGLKNFAGHLGMRYFFSDGFGLFTEFFVPFAKYKSGDLTPAEKLNNQFNVGIGASFNLD